MEYRYVCWYTLKVPYGIYENKRTGGAVLKKQLKIAAASLLAAFSMMILPMISYAADQGWKQIDGQWAYLDANGDKATSVFKASGNEWFYLDENGSMVKDELIEHNGNYYYLDANGVMKKNNWVELPNVEDDDEYGDTAWYYLQSSGKACIDCRKEINGQTYLFDDRGRVLYGWVVLEDDGTYVMADKSDDSTQWKEAQYYCGGKDDGAMVKGQWRRLHVYDPNPSDHKQNAGYNDYWFYFNTNGKKYRNEDDDKSYVQKTVGGYKYAFADDGHMLSEWVDEDGDSDGVKYFSDPSSGARVSRGWFKVVPSEKVDPKNSESGDNAAQWYYADSQGDLYTNAIKNINGRRYLFDRTGAMRTGLYYIIFNGDTISELHEIENKEASGDEMASLDTYTLPDSEYIPEDADSKTGLYYFAPPADTDGAMQTGVKDVNVDGEVIRFRFTSSGSNKGVGVNGREESSYYINGRLLKADSENKFDIYSCTFTENGKVDRIVERCTPGEVIDGAKEADYCVVSAAGTLIKSGTKKDAEGYRLTVKGYALVRVSTGNSDKDEKWEKK
jgi:glucan-binding YG repeat protein